MLLPLRHSPDMLVYPTISVLGYLTHFGHRVTWIISSEEESQLQDFFIDGARVYAVPYLHHLPRRSTLGGILNGVCHILKRVGFTLKVFREAKYDLVLVRESTTSILDALLAAYIIKRKYKIPFVFELPNPLEQRGQSYKMERKTLSYLVARLAAVITRHLIYRADLVLPISNKLKEHLTEQGVSESKMVTLPETAGRGTFSTRDRRRITENYHLNNCQVITYVGNMNKIRRLDVLVDAFHKLKQQTQRVKLLMVGDGDDKENLRELAFTLGLKDDIIFAGRVPQSEVPDFVVAGDVGVSSVPPLLSYKFSSPIKLFEYMAMAKPVVANEEIPEHKDVLEESGGGILVPFTSEAFAGGLTRLLNDPKGAVEMGRRGREWVAKNRSFEVLARQVEEAFLKITLRE